MPQYEYYCDHCDLSFERSCSISSRNNTICPVCNKDVRMLVSVGVTFGDEAAWINDEVRGTLQTEAEMRVDPITTRSQHNEYLKKKGLTEIG